MRVTFRKLLFFNEVNGFSVALYGGRYGESIPAVGYFLPTAPKIEYEINGEWDVDNKGRKTFTVSSYSIPRPNTPFETIEFLSSGLFRSMGKITARKVVALFGEDTLTVIENDPNRLLEIKGFSKKKLSSFMDSWNEQYAAKDLAMFLSQYKITPNKIMRIYKEFGAESLNIVKNDTYQLCNIDGFGFKTVDAIARNIGISSNSHSRIAAAALYILSEAQTSGHLFLPQTTFLNNLYELLNEGLVDEIDVTDREIGMSVEDMLEDQILVNEDGVIYSAQCYNAEFFSAKNIARIINSRCHRLVVSDKDIERAETELGMKLADKQKEAVKMCLENNISIITGGPGTGKTTTLNVILNIYKRNSSASFALLAPTGRAARRMSESTGHNASTIHSALHLNADSSEISDSTVDLDRDFVVVDEFSMVDMSLANHLFKSIENGTKVLLVGDPDQLPSVGAGNVFRELIGCGEIPVTTLDVIHRQAEESPIIANSHAINTGNCNLDFNKTTFTLIPREGALEAANTTVTLYQKALNHFPADEIQVLTPFRTRSEAGSQRLNVRLQELINPPDDKKNEIKYGEHTFREGDRIMQIKNNTCASNGDVGTLEEIYTDEDGDTILRISFSGGRIVEYTKSECEVLDLAYAITIHKSQGSEYKCVIIPMVNDFYIMLKRNLLYTAVTRAKEAVHIIGERSAVFTAIRKTDIDKRNTRLAERVISEMSAEKRKEK